MRLFEAIVDANHRALAGDASAGLRSDDFASELPIVALTCIDVRLNPLFPEVLGVAKEHFIWLRNAGNIITGPLSSTMRSLALACAIKGGKEIAIIGHNDCQVCKTSTLNLTEAFRALGIQRAALPENLTEFFGMFASERQNVMKAVEFTRHSPLIGPRVPVHGLMVDIATGKLEWVVNGYQMLEQATSFKAEAGKIVEGVNDAFKSLADFKMGDMKFPESKIGEAANSGSIWTTPPPAFTPAVPTQTTKPRTPPMPRTPPVVRPPPTPPPLKAIPIPPPVRPVFKAPKDRNF
jgi:carbonic anhydrase